MADLVDPGGVFAGEEAALGYEQRGERRPPRSRPVLLGDRGFGSVDGLGGGFEVDPGIGQAQPDRGAAVHGVGAEDPAQLGQQRVQPGIDRGRIGFSPQGLGQLVAGDLAVAVDDQVREQQPALAAGQARIQPLAVALDGQRSADLDPHAGAGTPRSRQHLGNTLSIKASKARWEGRWRS